MHAYSMIENTFFISNVKQWLISLKLQKKKHIQIMLI